MESSSGAGMRTNRKPKQSVSVQPKNKRSAEAKKNTAIRLSQALEELHHLDNDVTEEISNPLATDGNPFFNDDEYDFSEYDQDSPLADEDATDFLWTDEAWNLLESFQDTTSLPHVPNVMIDELGNVTIPAELKIIENWDGSQDSQDNWLVCRKLRDVMDALVLHVRNILLDPEKTLSDLPGLTQREFIKKWSLDVDEALMSRIVNRYVQTPFWGVVSLKEFFQNRKANKESWEAVLRRIGEYVEKEEPDHPVKTTEIWNRFKEDLLGMSREKTPDDQAIRTLKNHLRTAGIPLETPRKEIFIMVKQWVKDNAITRINQSELPLVRLALIQNYKLFQTKKTRTCLESQYESFIENRIARVLHQSNVEVMDD